MTDTAMTEVLAGEPNHHGYRTFQLGEFAFERDEYFAYVRWPTGTHTMSVDAFLRAAQRDVAWNFFYGTVNFDNVVGSSWRNLRPLNIQSIGIGKKGSLVKQRYLPGRFVLPGCCCLHLVIATIFVTRHVTNVRNVHHVNNFKAVKKQQAP